MGSPRGLALGSVLGRPCRQAAKTGGFQRKGGSYYGSTWGDAADRLTERSFLAISVLSLSHALEHYGPGGFSRLQPGISLTADGLSV